MAASDFCGLVRIWDALNVAAQCGRDLLKVEKAVETEKQAPAVFAGGDF